MICRRAPKPHPAIAGRTVYRMHGGWAPQLRAKAEARLLAGADYAAVLLVRQALNRRLDPERPARRRDRDSGPREMAPREERDKEPPMPL